MTTTPQSRFSPVSITVDMNPSVGPQHTQLSVLKTLARGCADSNLLDMVRVEAVFPGDPDEKHAGLFVVTGVGHGPEAAELLQAHEGVVRAHVVPSRGPIWS